MSSACPVTSYPIRTTSTLLSVNFFRTTWTASTRSWCQREQAQGTTVPLGSKRYHFYFVVVIASFASILTIECNTNCFANICIVAGSEIFELGCGDGRCKEPDTHRQYRAFASVYELVCFSPVSSHVLCGALTFRQPLWLSTLGMLVKENFPGKVRSFQHVTWHESSMLLD